MRIAIHNAQMSYHLGGTERLIYNQIVNLLKFPDVCIHLVTSKTSNPSELYLKLRDIKNSNFLIDELDSLESLKIENPYTSNNPLKWHLESVVFGCNAVKFYQNKVFDLIVTHFSTDSLFIPLKTFNILHLHGCPTEYSEIGDLSINRADIIVSVSNYVKNRWTELYPKLNNKNSFVVYPGIDSSVFYDMGLDRSIDILFVGRLILIKGVYTLLEAVSNLNKNFKMVIVGNGPEKENIEKKINDLKLDQSVSLLSNLSDEDVVKLYNSAKVVVFPSFAKEGMGLTMLEAASCGCSVIASNCCSMPEFLKNGENGLLFEPKNSIELSQKINLLLSDSLLRHKLGKKARTDIEGFWDNEERIKDLYEKYLEVYNKNAKTNNV